jgi:aerobic-type carbon monoxide dehydrogenase small subunit (CoxS/CutS family)
MSSLILTVNGKQQTVDVSPDTPLLWVLRVRLGLTRTKFECGMAQILAANQRASAVSAGADQRSSAVNSSARFIRGPDED